MAIAGAAPYQADKRAVIALNHPAFLHLEGESRGTPELIVSSFGVFGGDAVRRIRNLPGILKGEKPVVDVITDKVTWPNEAKRVPLSLGGPDTWLIAGGFLVPGKTGALTMVKAGGEPRTLTQSDPVSERKGGWFYHRTYWRDMDGDGHLDILTARGKKAMTGGSFGELLWLKRPVQEGAPWQETVIGKGPDVHFRLADLDQDGKEEILAGEFFTKRFSVWWREGGTWKSRVIDNKCGSAFDLEVADLNGDGRRDVVLTNHENNANASVFAYEIPADWRTGLWPRHTLVSGIETRQGGMGPASPGAPVVVPGATRDGKALILVAGDGSQRVHLLSPSSSVKTEWRYQFTDLDDLKCTVGQLAAADLDGDGLIEVLAPAYDQHQIHVYTLRQAARRQPAKRS